MKNAQGKRVESLSERALGKVCVAVILLGGPTGTAAGTQQELVLSDVSKDRSVFEPQKSERLTLRFSVSQPSSLLVQFHDPFNYPVRTIRFEAKRAGKQSVVWKGRDDEGHLVPPEAYTYTITASSTSSGDGTPPLDATYDLSTTTGGQPLAAQDMKIDPGARSIAYTLSKAARVRVILGRGLWPAGTPIDWAPRPAGKHEERWEADMDPLEGAKGVPPIMGFPVAFTLPDNAVIVRGEYQTDHTPRPPPSNLPYRLQRETTSNDSHVHASHPRARCYNPAITVTFPEDVDRDAGLARISAPTVLKFDIVPEQGTRRLAPIPRVSIAIYVDSIKAADLLAGYAPYHWLLDPSKYAAGVHLITCAFTWKSDHFGFAHAMVLIE